MIPKINLISDSSIEILFPNEISKDINKKIRMLTKVINEKIGDDIVDIIPAYHNILINFDCLKTNSRIFYNKVKKIVATPLNEQTYKIEVVEIPVCYEKPFSLDIEDVCKINNMSKEELIKRHTSPEYLVYMIGFTPGFPYLGGMDNSISTPRKKQPRTSIPAGSVGIAGSQTGIYPIESPGGWQIIGQTPYNLFDPYREPAVLIEAGQYIKFRSISKGEFESIVENLEVNNGKF